MLRLALLIIAVCVLGAICHPVDSASAADKSQPGAFDKEAFDRANKIVGDEAKKHVLALRLRQTNLQAYLFLVGVAPKFIRDEQGRLNENADQAAFTSAVTSMTRARLDRCRELTGEVDAAAAFVALMIPTGAFLQKGSGFNRSAFVAAFEKIDVRRTQAAAKMMNTRGGVALIHLLTAAAACVDGNGKFDPALFDSRFNALRESQFTGNEHERIETFLKSMRPAQP